MEVGRRIKDVWIQKFSKKTIGEIIAYQSPRIVLVRQFDNKRVNFGNIVLLKDPFAPIKLGVALDYIGRDESILLRILEIDVPSELKDDISKSLKSISSNTAAVLEDDHILNKLDAESYLINVVV